MMPLLAHAKTRTCGLRTLRGSPFHLEILAAEGLARRGSKIYSIRRRRDRRWQMAVQWYIGRDRGVHALIGIL